MAGNDTVQTYFSPGTRVTWLERNTITELIEPALQIDLGAHVTILRFLGLNVGCQFLSSNMASCGGGAGLNIPFYTH